MFRPLSLELWNFTTVPITLHNTVFMQESGVPFLGVEVSCLSAKVSIENKKAAMQLRF